MDSTVSDKDRQLREQFDVAFALAIDRAAAEQPCPDEEELVAWHEKRLPESRREELTAHLASCNSCYLVWQELAELSEPSVIEQKQPVLHGGKSTLCSFFEKMADFCKPGPVALGGFGTAIAAVLLVFVLLPTIRSSRIDRNLEQSFSARSLLLAPGVNDPVFRSKSLNISRAQYPVPELGWVPRNPQQQAFAVGVYEAAQGLEENGGSLRKKYAHLPDTVSMTPDGVSEKAWVRRQQALRQAGRWAILLASSCEQPALFSTSFWDDQKSILHLLDKEIEAYPERDEFSLFFESWVAQADGDMCRKGKELLQTGFGRPVSGPQ